MRWLHFHIYNALSSLLPAKPFHVRVILMKGCGIRVGSGVNVSANVKFYNHYASIGDHTWISPDCSFYTGKLGFVSIGSACDIGPGVSFVTGSHEIGNHQRRAGLGFSKDISIGDGSWVGARAVILGGADIGLGSVIGAGALVLPGRYAPNSLLVGVPAKAKRALE